MMKSLFFVAALAFAAGNGRLRRQAQKGSIQASRDELDTPETKVPVITVPLFESRLYAFGKSADDKHLPIQNDYAEKLTLRQPLKFFGKEKKTAYILTNGGIGFHKDSGNYTKEIYNDKYALIAPFWLPNDMLKGGQIYYREVTSDDEDKNKDLRRGLSEIRYHYDLDEVPKAALIVTWVDMQPPINLVPTRSRGGYKIEKKKNIVQAAIFTTPKGTFANFIYKKIEWGRHARGGFNRGEGWIQYYKLPGLGTTMLKVLGNTGVPGEWMFKIDGENIIRCRPGFTGDLCDSNCAPYFWGYDCANACKCGGLVCDNISGSCPV